MSCKYSNESIIAALLKRGTVPGAAKDLGMSRGALYSRMKDPEFRKEFNEAKAEFMKMATAELQHSAQAAVATIHGIMIDPETPKQIRLNAAAIILQYCGKFTEQVDIIERIERLEQAAADE